MTFIRWRKLPSILIRWEFLSRIKDFVKCFSRIFWDNHMAFLFEFINMANYMTDFQMLNKSCIPGINPSCSYYLFYSLLVCLAKVLFRIFESVYKEYCSVVFFYKVFVWFWYQRRVCIISILFISQIFCRIHQWSNLGLEFSLWNGF